MLDPRDAAAITDFLAGRRFAFIGASRDEAHFNTVVYRALRDHGYEVLPVHPSAETIAGDRCYRSIAELPLGVDGLVVMVAAPEVQAVVDSAHAAGVERIWLHRGVGRGAVSPEAVAWCRERGIAVVAGACPLMYLEPTRGIHAFHRLVSRRRLPAA